MREKLKGSLLSSADVENLGGVYVGEVADVVEEDVRSPGTGRTERDAVVEFTDSIRWVPSNSAKRTLIKLHGFETDTWRGKTIEINLRERRGQLEKFVVEPDGPAPDVKGASDDEGSTPPPQTTSEAEVGVWLVAVPQRGIVRLTLRAAECRDAASTSPLPSASLSA